jgi:hypothetical protein
MINGKPLSAVVIDGRRQIALFRRRRLAFEKKKLGSEQTHTLGTGFNCARGFGGFADVRDDLDAVAVGHDRGLVACFELHFAPALQIHAKLFRRFKIGFGRRDIEPAGAAIEDAERAGLLLEHGCTCADDRRDIERARDNRGVRGGSTRSRAKSENTFRIEPGGIRRGEIFRDQDHGLVRQCTALLGTSEKAEDALANVVQIRGPTGKTLIRDLLDFRDPLIDHLLPRPRGAVTGLDQFVDFAEQIDIG